MGVGVVVLFLIMVLWGFYKDDLGWLYVIVVLIMYNLVGWVGVWIVDLMFYVFGFLVWWWIVLLGMFVWWGFCKFNIVDVGDCWLFFIVLVGFVFLLVVSLLFEVLCFYMM